MATPDALDNPTAARRQPNSAPPTELSPPPTRRRARRRPDRSQTRPAANRPRPVVGSMAARRPVDGTQSASSRQSDHSPTRLAANPPPARRQPDCGRTRPAPTTARRQPDCGQPQPDTNPDRSPSTVRRPPVGSLTGKLRGRADGGLDSVVAANGPRDGPAGRWTGRAPLADLSRIPAVRIDKSSLGLAEVSFVWLGLGTAGPICQNVNASNTSSRSVATPAGQERQKSLGET